MRYAEHTCVSVEKSKGEIEFILTRYGAESFATATSQGRALLIFEMNNRRIRFLMPLPDRTSKDITHRYDGRARTHKRRSDLEQVKAWEQACRQRWRALCLAIKAKLEAVECGITTFEEEFLAHFMIPGKNQTFGELMIPQIDGLYQGKKFKNLLEYIGG